MSKRKREMDMFPQQIQDAFNCATVQPLVSATTSGVITQTIWDLPVTLDLDHPTFIECSKVHATQQPPLTVNAIAAGVIGAPSQMVIREIKIMKEARGTVTWPGDDDRATLATFRLQSSFIATSGTTQGVTYTDMSQWEYFEDARTGLGALIAQPRLFVLTRTTVAAASPVDPAAVGSKDVFLSMHYRMTKNVPGKEWLTELIAQNT